MSKSLNFTKENFLYLQKAKENLEIDLQKIKYENEKLKKQNQDMKITVKENKKVLQNFFSNMENKDELLNKLNLVIKEQNEKIQILESKLKGMKSYDFTSLNFININQNNNYSLSSPNIFENNQNNKENPDCKISYLIEMREKQNKINQEIIEIKKQVENLIEKNSFKNKLNQNIIKEEDCIDEIDINKETKISFISDDISDLSESLDENWGKNTILKLKNKFILDNNLDDFFEKFNDKKEELYFVDGRNKVWQLVLRNDLSVENLNTSK